MKTTARALAALSEEMPHDDEGLLVTQPDAVVSCPRCGRWGLVIVNRKEDDHVVLWADQRVGHLKDTGVSGDELVRGDFGCGFDDEGARAAWDGTRRLHIMNSDFDPAKLAWIAERDPFAKTKERS
jgi:hypothetical protein